MRDVRMLGLLLGSSGCLMAGNYHSAKTLAKGESQFGMIMSATRFDQRTTYGGAPAPKVLPELTPEVTYHVGVTDDLEVGGRVAASSLGLEADMKYRLFKSDSLHLAVAPAINYQALGLWEGFGLRLPGILTYQLADSVDATVAVFESTTYFSAPIDGVSNFSTDRGSLFSVGGAFGIELHGEMFSVRTSVEFTRYLANVTSNLEVLSESLDTVNFLVHVAWTGGTTKKPLGQI